MPQTFYIESDEEIISVIGRLRRSSAEENFFVFPKRALVLQSIINLRLFEREAEKLGKRIVIVTQDEAGKVLAEKAGLVTERYTDDFSRQAEHLEIVPSLEKKRVVLNNRSDATLRSQDIGSSDFYSGASEISTPPIKQDGISPVQRTLRIRNVTPGKLTSLNSKRSFEESIPSAPVMVQRSPQRPPRVSQPASIPSYRQEEGGRSVISPSREMVQNHREERLKNFFSNGSMNSTPVSRPVVSREERQESTTQTHVIAPSKVKGIFFLLGGVSLLSLIGVTLFLFLPKAELHVVPYRSVQSVDLQFEGRPDAVDDKNTIPVRVVRKEQGVTLSVEATGVAPGSAQKARGTITISNAYSSDAQSLVATTRFESSQGKIFRLQEGITVPGMKNGQPGTVEAVVVADEPGTEYNITGTTFVIPGFKGSPKYDKFSAQSTKAMAGGSDASGKSDQKVISKLDLEKAAQSAKQKAKEDYLASVMSELKAGEKILEENIDIVALKDAELPLSGTVASSFEYKNTYVIRSFVFSEDVIKQKIETQGKETVGGVMFHPVSMVLTYGESPTDYDKQTVRLKAHALITSESAVDEEKFKNAILGKDEEGINTLLSSFPEIKKLSIIFKPQWFTSTIPSNIDRVTVVMEPGEE